MKKLTREEVIEKLSKGDKDFKNLDLSDLDLRMLDLSYSNLSNTNLSYANLVYAILDNTDLSYANLEHAYLSNAILDEKEQIRKGMILKESMIGYKKCKLGTIVTLEIPKGASVFSINNDKCRTNKAKVIEISDGKKIAYSNYDNFFIYKLGKEIEVKDFDLRYNVECSSGIHFFRTRKEAENY